MASHGYDGMKRWLTDALERPDLSDDTELHLDSIQFVELITRLEAILQREVEPSETDPEHFATLARIRQVFLREEQP